MPSRFQIPTLLATLALIQAPPAFALGRLAQEKPAPAASAVPAPQAAPQATPPAAPWKAAEVVAAGRLASRLGKKDAPVVLHVGPPALYEAGHIPGAAAAGPGAEPAGIKRLMATVARLPRNREVVVYCGCCPIQDCPNLKPAYKTLKGKGFKNVKVLDLPADFTIDWAKKGLPVDKGMPIR